MKEDLTPLSEFSQDDTVAPAAMNFLPTWRQRGEFLIGMLMIHTLDHLVSDNLTKSGILSASGNLVVASFEDVGGIVLMVLAVVSLIASIKPFQRLLIPFVGLYLTLAIVHLYSECRGDPAHRRNEGESVLAATRGRGRRLFYGSLCFYGRLLVSWQD